MVLRDAASVLPVLPILHQRTTAPTHPTHPKKTDALSGWSEQLVASLQPPETDAAVRAAFVQHLRRVLAPFLTPVGGTLDVFGSSATGLHLPGADVDLVLSLGQETHREKNGKIVKQLAARLRSARPAFASVHAIPGARVPIVTVASNAFGLTADISVNNKLPLANTQLLRTYMLIDDRVRRLCYVVKRWAKQRRLSEAFDHTPSSYAWVLLVIFYGQQQGLVPNLQQDSDADSRPLNTPIFNAQFLTPDRRRVRCRFCTDVDAASRRLAEAASSCLAGQGGPAAKAEATGGGGAASSLGTLVLGFFQWLARADLQRHVVSIRASVALDASSKHWGGTHGGRSKERHLFQIEASRN